MFIDVKRVRVSIHLYFDSVLIIGYIGIANDLPVYENETANVRDIIFFIWTMLTLKLIKRPICLCFVYEKIFRADHFFNETVKALLKNILKSI